MRKLLMLKLYVTARLILSKFRPRIVAITGSVGKTSTKTAVTKVLSSRGVARSSQANYNNEFGVPLAIIGADSPGRSLLGWLGLFFKSLRVLLGSSYPKVLVLEVGTDRPGDIAYLARMLGNIEIAVITDIGVSHLQYFASPQALAKEKLSLIKNLDPASTAVLNFDNPKIWEGRKQTKAQVLGYGFSDSAQLQASDFHVLQSEGRWGANFKVHYEGNVVPFFVPGALGHPALYAALAATAVGLRFGMNLVEIADSLRSYESPPGRLKLLPGIKHTQVIDDTYNAAPASTLAALEVLDQVAQTRKVAVIGSMAELGEHMEEGHREVARKIMEIKTDLVFLVGQNAQIIQDELAARKFGGRVSWYADSDDAGIPVQNAILPGDVILIKGSQSSRMEKIVKEIMAEPLRAPELLVRQDEKWL